MQERVHIFGASGSGTSTLGRELARGCRSAHFDADDLYWEPSDPPYRNIRDRSIRQKLLIETLSGSKRWVLSGSICGWGDAAIGLFDLVVFVVTSTDVRLERLISRERLRFGNRISETGDMYEQHVAFLEWAAGYDDGPVGMRSRSLHEEWLNRIDCPIVRVDGVRPLDVLCEQIMSAMST